MLLGVEIGGTKLQAGLVDARGRLLRLERRAVDRARGRVGILLQLRELLPPLIGSYRPTAIGIGFGGPVDLASGRVVKSHQVGGWSGFGLRAWGLKQFGLPVVVENDTNCAGLAEARLGAGKGQPRVFYFNVGTGIGGALVVNSQLYNGRFGAMELGHTRVWGHGRWDKLENVASGLAIERGISTLRQSAEYVGMAVANAVTLVNPDVVVVGGGVPLAGERFWQPLRRQVQRWVFEPYRRNYRLVPAKLREGVVVVGAALVAGDAGRLGRPSTSTSTSTMQRTDKIRARG